MKKYYLILAVLLSSCKYDKTPNVVNVAVEYTDSTIASSKKNQTEVQELLKKLDSTTNSYLLDMNKKAKRLDKANRELLYQIQSLEDSLNSLIKYQDSIKALDK